MLLEDEVSLSCLSNFAHFLLLLDLYENEIPHSLLEELRALVDDYVETNDGQIVFRCNEITDEQKTALTENLLSIYIEIKGGDLVF